MGHRNSPPQWTAVIIETIAICFKAPSISTKGLKPRADNASKGEWNPARESPSGNSDFKNLTHSRDKRHADAVLDNGARQGAAEESFANAA
jgi:hypothetical protein